MEEPIIIELHVRPEILISYASTIKHECKKYEICEECPMHQLYKGVLTPTCPFFNSENPEDWLVN